MSFSSTSPLAPLPDGDAQTCTMRDSNRTAIDALLDELGIPKDLLEKKQLPFYPVATQLVLAETGANGMAHRLVPEAAMAWQCMKQAAQGDGIILEIVSAFRDLEEQSEIIRDKRRRGMPIETILSLSAPPGYSEHHTGYAIDINTPGCREREEDFEDTAAFRWLSQHAQQFGFVLSYPRGNTTGFIYEPWHWLFKQDPQSQPE